MPALSPGITVSSACLNLSRAGPPRHVAAWLRGCCYLAAGNFRQALQDARTALAYAPAAAVSKTAAAAAAAAAPAPAPAQKAAVACEPAQPVPATTLLDTEAPEVIPTTNMAGHGAAVEVESATLHGPVAAPDVAAEQQRKSSSGWLPALLLAGEAYAGLGEHAQAVVHLAQVGT